MKFITELMNRLSDALAWYCLQRPEDIHTQVNAAFSNAALKGVGFLKIDDKGKVTSIDPEGLVITVMKEKGK